MKTTGWLRRAVTTAAIFAVVSASTAAGAEPTTRTVTARNFAYEPTPTTVDTGDRLQLTNADAAPHDIRSRQAKADGSPLFASPVIGQGRTAPVAGVEDLLPGNYPFYCSLHAQMAGTLVVGASSQVPEVPRGPVVVNVPTPTSIAALGGRLYVASYATGTVFELPILPGGVPGPAQPYVTGLSSPLGVVVASDGTLFVSDSHRAATPGRTTAGRVWAIHPGGGAAGDVGEVVVDELPNGRHNTNGLAVHDGRLYIANGNSTDDGVAGGEPEQPLSGTLVSVPLDARGVVVGTPTEQLLRVEAVGMRNIYDVAFRPGTSEAWLPMNGLDAQDPWGEDLLLRTDVAPPEDADGSGRVPDDFGFPGCVYAAGHTPSYRQNANAAVSDVCDGTQTPPEQLMGLHTSANGLAFAPQEAWDGDLFVTLFGNFFGDEVVGHRIVRVPIDAAGRSSPPVDFLPSPAPLDLTFVGTDMYVADFAVGVVLVKPPGV